MLLFIWALTDGLDADSIGHFFGGQVGIGEWTLLVSLFKDIIDFSEFSAETAKQNSKVFFYNDDIFILRIKLLRTVLGGEGWGQHMCGGEGCCYRLKITPFDSVMSNSWTLKNWFTYGTNLSIFKPLLPGKVPKWALYWIINKVISSFFVLKGTIGHAPPGYSTDYPTYDWKRSAWYSYFARALTPIGSYWYWTSKSPRGLVPRSLRILVTNMISRVMSFRGRWSMMSCSVNSS